MRRHVLASVEIVRFLLREAHKLMPNVNYICNVILHTVKIREVFQMRTAVRVFQEKIFSFCLMERLNEKICLYIDKHWIRDMTNRAFAIANDIDEKTVRRIKEIKEQDYSISIETLKKICSAQGVKLSDFFEKIGE